MRILEILQKKACTIFFLFFKWKLSLRSPLATAWKFFCLPFSVSCSLSIGHCNIKWTRGNFFKEMLPAALMHYTSPSLKRQRDLQALNSPFSTLTVTYLENVKSAVSLTPNLSPHSLRPSSRYS